jgi:Tfp pilus assembly protein PilF
MVDIPAKRKAEIALWTKAEYIEHLQERRRELDGSRAGARRAIGLAIGYLRTCETARARWILESAFEAEEERPGDFWADNRAALASILQELLGVGS